MIIKMTFEDNDFTRLIKQFVADLYLRISKLPISNELNNKLESYILEDKEIELSKEETDSVLTLVNQCNFLKENTKNPRSSILSEYLLFRFTYMEKMNSIVNPNVNQEITDNDIAFLLRMIVEHFTLFLDEQDVHQDTKNYLISHFQVKVVPNYQEDWQNGEVLYYFTTNNKYLVN